MNNVAHLYRDYAKNAKYGDGYDVLFHGVQTALTVLGYSNADGVSRADIKYGYFGVDTESMIKKYQGDKGLKITGKLDNDTFQGIFATLLNEKGLVVLRESEDSISLVDVDEYLEGSKSPNTSFSTGSNGVTVETNTGNTLLSGAATLADSLGPSFTKPITGILDSSLVSSGILDPFKDLMPSLDGDRFNDLNYGYHSGGGKDPFAYSYNLYSGSETLDDLMYDYITSGGRVPGTTSYEFNLSGGITGSEYTTPDYVGDSDRDYDYIYGLFANSIYDGAVNKASSWASNSDESSIKNYAGGFETSSNLPFFDPSCLSILRQSKFDLTVVYGASGKYARKILEVTPISVTQEFDASGEPIYDVYEFLAKDIVYSV